MIATPAITALHKAIPVRDTSASAPTHQFRLIKVSDKLQFDPAQGGGCTNRPWEGSCSPHSAFLQSKSLSGSWEEQQPTMAMLLRTSSMASGYQNLACNSLSHPQTLFSGEFSSQEKVSSGWDGVEKFLMRTRMGNTTPSVVCPVKDKTCHPPLSTLPIPGFSKSQLQLLGVI